MTWVMKVLPVADYQLWGLESRLPSNRPVLSFSGSFGWLELTLGRAAQQAPCWNGAVVQGLSSFCGRHQPECLRKEKGKGRGQNPESVRQTSGSDRPLNQSPGGDNQTSSFFWSARTLGREAGAGCLDSVLTKQLFCLRQAQGIQSEFVSPRWLMDGQIGSRGPAVLPSLLPAGRELCSPHTPSTHGRQRMDWKWPEHAGPVAVSLGAAGLGYHISQTSGTNALSDAHL